VAGGEARIGGGPWHAARALRALGQEAIVLGKCGPDERAPFARRLASLGVPATLVAEGRTTAFSFSYDAAHHRTMAVDAIGEPWREEELASGLLRRVEWVHLAPLLRGDFPAGLLERLARGRRLLLDGQGLVRPRRVGQLELDADFDRELLRHVSVLKLAEEEARAIVGEGPLEDLRALGVPEVLVTFGASGALVLTRGLAERVRVYRVDADPTGAGDAFATAYIVGRNAGFNPVGAARRATAVVASLLGSS
jgi:sugar/nucleoside kinase (ribokinase family)